MLTTFRISRKKMAAQTSNLDVIIKLQMLEWAQLPRDVYYLVSLRQALRHRSVKS